MHPVPAFMIRIITAALGSSARNYRVAAIQHCLSAITYTWGQASVPAWPLCFSLVFVCVCAPLSLSVCVCLSLSILLHSRLPPPCPKLSIIPRELFTPVYEVQCLKKEADTVEANEAMSLNRSACRLSGVDLSFTKSRLLISTNLNRRALDIQRHSWL